MCDHPGTTSQPRVHAFTYSGTRVLICFGIIYGLHCEMPFEGVHYNSSIYVNIVNDGLLELYGNVQFRSLCGEFHRHFVL